VRYFIPLAILVSFACVAVGWWVTEWLSDRRASDFDDKHTSEREEDS